MPEIKNLSSLKYEKNEIDPFKNGKGEEINKLHQYEHHISKKYQIWSLAPKVISFKI